MATRKLPVIAAPPAPIVIKGKAITTIVASEPAPQKPLTIEITAAQLVKPDEANADHVMLSQLFHEHCKALKVQPTERQARKARQGGGAWAAIGLQGLLRKPEKRKVA